MSTDTMPAGRWRCLECERPIWRSGTWDDYLTHYALYHQKGHSHEHE